MVRKDSRTLVVLVEVKSFLCGLEVFVVLHRNYEIPLVGRNSKLASVVFSSQVHFSYLYMPLIILALSTNAEVLNDRNGGNSTDDSTVQRFCGVFKAAASCHPKQACQNSSAKDSSESAEPRSGVRGHFSGQFAGAAAASQAFACEASDSCHATSACLPVIN